MPEFKDLTAAIIAGGKSVRFGEPKALVRLGHQELIDFAINLARAVSAEYFLVYGKRNLYSRKNIEGIPDAIPGCGPLGGIYSALEHAGTPWVAVIPCDMPFLKAEVYQILYRHRDANLPVVALSHQGIEPLVSIWPRGMIPQLRSAIQIRAFSLHEFLGQFQAREISLPQVIADYRDEMFLNINNRSDIELARRIGRNFR